MGSLPPFDINHLVRLRDVGEGRPDHASRFIGSECRVAVYAYVHGMNAFTRREPVGTLSFLRLMCEATIRVRWLCGDEDTGTESGQLRVDGPTVRLRAQQLEKRDLLQMLSAYTAVHGATNREGALREELAKHIAQFDAPPAPATVKDLATSWSARAMYSTHRLCSSRIHPGASLGRTDVFVSGEDLPGQFEGVGHMCTAWTDAALWALTA